MRQGFVSLLALSLLALSGMASAEDGPLGPVLLAGQSNAGGESLRTHLQDEIYPYSVLQIHMDGTSLFEDWQPDGVAWRHFVARIEEERSERDLTRFKRLVWVQGEADAGNQQAAEAYAENLMELFSRIREELGIRHFRRVVIAEVAPLYEFSDVVVEAQREVASRRPEWTTIRTEDIWRGRDPWTQKSGQPANLSGTDVYPLPYPEDTTVPSEQIANLFTILNSIHYNSAGQRRLAERISKVLGAEPASRRGEPRR